MPVIIDPNAVVLANAGRLLMHNGNLNTFFEIKITMITTV